MVPGQAAAVRRTATRAHRSEAEASADDPSPQIYPHSSGRVVRHMVRTAAGQLIARRPYWDLWRHSGNRWGRQEPPEQVQGEGHDRHPAPTHHTRDTHANDELLTLSEVAELVRVPVATLRYWRHLGSGPQSFRIGRTVRYWRSDVFQWLEKQSSRPQGSC